MKAQLSHRPSLAPFAEFVHFACTSEDINNLATAMLKHARTQLIKEDIEPALHAMETLTMTHASVPYLSRTHGQPATRAHWAKKLRTVCIDYADN